MNYTQKQEIRLALSAFVDGFPSQRQAVAQLRNVSEATLINLLSSRWEKISDDMFRNIGKQVGWHIKTNWQMAETLAMNTLMTYYADAKDYGNVYAISAPAGSGKSYTADLFSRHKSNVFHIECKEYWNRKTYLRKILEKMGREHAGLNVAELMDEIVSQVLRMDDPLIILDEFDKLNDQLMYFFISFYNELHGKCGIVIQGTEYLGKRIRRGADNNKKGYEEIYSRIGRRFIHLPPTSKAEIADICKANGLSNSVDIQEIYNEYNGDLRRVARAIHKNKQQASRNAA